MADQPGVVESMRYGREILALWKQCSIQIRLDKTALFRAIMTINCITLSKAQQMMVLIPPNGHQRLDLSL
jgi:hypothetical protein